MKQKNESKTKKIKELITFIKDQSQKDNEELESKLVINKEQYERERD